MRRGLGLLLAAGLLGCLPGAGRGPRGEAPADGGLRAYKRFAILPFNDARGMGEEYAAEVGRGLWKQDFDVIAGPSLAGALDQMGVTPGETMGQHDLLELRRLTHADAAVFGAVSCPRGKGRNRASMVIMDTATGEPVFDFSFWPRLCGTRRHVPVISERLVLEVRKKAGPRRMMGDEDHFRRPDGR